MMEVILLERIENLGQMGDVVRVKDGYARNYLLRQKKALRATKGNMERFEQERVQLEADNLDRRKDAEAVGVKLDGLSVVMLRQAAESAQLYGSVNARDVAKAVTDAGFTVGRRQVLLGAAIKSLGVHPVRVALHPEVTVLIEVNVARSAEEAEMQARAGAAIAAGAVEAVEETASVEEFFEEEALHEAEDEIAAAESAEVEATDEESRAPAADEPAETEEAPAEKGPEAGNGDETS
jgi:large subunit ribosomal protein L9